MVEARNEDKLSLYLRQFKKIDLLILDELGYVTFDLDGAKLLFQLLATRYETMITIINSGVTSIFVCNEVFHRVMFAELFKEHNIDAKYAIKYLKNNPDVIKELGADRYAIENIEPIENLTIVGVEREALDLALEFSGKYGLLATDAIHAATMKMEGLSILATNDRDFERVDWLWFWRP